MHLAPKVVAFAIALALCIGLPALSIAAKSKNTAVEKTVVDEKAAQLLAQGCKALTALSAYSFQATVTLDKVYQVSGPALSGSKPMVMTSMPFRFSMARPSRWHFPIRKSTPKFQQPWTQTASWICCQLNTA